MITGKALHPLPALRNVPDTSCQRRATLPQEIVADVCAGLRVEPIPAVRLVFQIFTTKNPKQTIRNAIGQGYLIVATGDGRYGWRPRLMTGSVLRLTLSAAAIAGPTIEFGDEIRDALWPTFFESGKRSDREPVTVDLSNGQVTAWSLDFLGSGAWGTRGAPEFWTWFNGLGATPGDHLLIEVLDGQAKRHRLEFQPRAGRDEATIAARNQAIIEAALAFVGKRHQGTAIWDITRHLLCTGHYRHPVPPDPLAEIWQPEVWQDRLAATQFRGEDDWYFTGEKVWQPQPDASLSALFGGPVQVYDYENPPNLPREYDPDRGERRPPAFARRCPGYRHSRHRV